MALFNRNNDKKVVLPELEKYYDAERRERSGLAWILALVSIAVVALILISIFFGGRWIYRQLSDDKVNTADTVQTDKNYDDKDGEQKANDSNDDSAVSTPATPAPSTVNTPTATTKPATPSVSTPSTATKLSNTGPTSMVAYFLSATLIGTFLYRLKLLRNR